MAYLIDASSFIEAKNRYYAFDFCPGFWDWLDFKNKASLVYSIDRIRSELEAGSDILAQWAHAHGPGFFLPVDAATTAGVMQVNQWVMSAGFSPHAQSRFLSGADPFLVAYAMAHSHTVVTDEIYQPGEKKKIKIPGVSRQFNVPCMSPFDMLRQGGARFVLPGHG